MLNLLGLRQEAEENKARTKITASEKAAPPSKWSFTDIVETLEKDLDHQATSFRASAKSIPEMIIGELFSKLIPEVSVQESVTALPSAAPKVASRTR